MRPLTTALSASVLTALALAQEPERVPAKPPIPQVAAPAPARAVPGHGFVLEAGDVSIEELIDSAAQFLNRNILYLPQELQSGGGKGGGMSVHLQNRLELDANGCEEMLCTLLYSRGLALTVLDPGRNLYEVIQMAGPRGKEIATRAVYMTPDEVLRRPLLRMPILTTVELQHINAPVAVNALRPFFGQSGNLPTLQLGNAGNNASLLLQGFADQVAVAIRLLRECDKPPPPNQPPELVTRIQQLEQQVQSLREQLARKADKPEKQG